MHEKGRAFVLLMEDSSRPLSRQLDDRELRARLHTDGISTDYRIPQLRLLRRSQYIAEILLRPNDYQFESLKSAQECKKVLNKRIEEIVGWFEDLKMYFKSYRLATEQDDKNLTQLIENRKIEIQLIQMRLGLLKPELQRLSQAPSTKNRRTSV